MKAINKIKILILVLSTLIFTFENLTVKTYGVDQNYNLKDKNESKHLEKTSISKKTIVLGTIGLTIVVGGVITLIIKGNNSKNNEYKSSWREVAELYKRASDNDKFESAEYYEHLADYYRCLTYEDLEILESQKNMPNKIPVSSSNFFKGCTEYREAANLYTKRASQFNEGCYDYQINSVKAAELLAKAEELRREANDIANQDRGFVGGRIVTWNPDTRRISICSVSYDDVANEWEKVKCIKPSYDAYADAKCYECMAKHNCDKNSWKEAANAWEKVENDEELKKSFGGETKSWFAYRAFADAKRQECLLKCDATSKEKVNESWLKASRLDLEASNSAIYKAFAAEARQRASYFKN